MTDFFDDLKFLEPKKKPTVETKLEVTALRSLRPVMARAFGDHRVDALLTDWVLANTEKVLETLGESVKVIPISLKSCVLPATDDPDLRRHGLTPTLYDRLCLAVLLDRCGESRLRKVVRREAKLFRDEARMWD